MEVVVEPLDLETDIKEIQNIVDLSIGIECGRGSVCEVGLVKQNRDAPGLKIANEIGA